MKRYNKGNHNMVLLGIIIPILAFFISMNITFAFFTATANGDNTSSQTAVLKIKFTEDSEILANSQTITDSTMIIPGKTITANAVVENESNTPVYTMIGFKVFVKKANSSTLETVEDSYYTIINATPVKIIKTGNTYSQSAFTLEAPNEDKDNYYQQDFNLSYTFDFNQFNNAYQNAEVTYSLKAYAIQTATIENAETATQILMNRFIVDNQYQQVEYIETTGTQYIDTKFVPNQNTKIETEVAMDTPTSTQAIFCAREKYKTNSFTLFKRSSNELRYDYGSSIVTISNEFDTAKHTIIADKNKLYVDSVLKGEASNEEFSSPTSLWIGASHSTENDMVPENYCYAKFYSFKIYNNNSLIKYLVPCYRIEDNEIGLFDLISGEFYSNSGTGQFNKGANI